MAMVTTLNKLPIVVIEPGMYNTRNGRMEHALDLVAKVENNHD